MSVLDDILAMLSEEELARQVYVPHDMARQSYQLEKGTVSNHDEFRYIIADYYKHHFAQTVSGQPAMPDDMAEGNAREILEKVYANEGGVAAALDYSKTGERGGLRRVLDAIAEHMKRDLEKKYIWRVHDTFIDPLDKPQQIELVREYFNKFRAYLPAHVLNTDPAYYARNWEELLEQHREIMKHIRARMH